MKKATWWLLATMLIFLGINTPGFCQSVTIASIFAKTGKAAKGNRTAIEGVRFAVKKLNERGGVLGRPIRIIEYDNRSTPLHSKKAASQAVKDGVSAVIGANWSSHSLAMAPVLQAARIPMLSPYSTNPAVTPVGDYIFRLCFLDSFQGRLMAAFAARDMAVHTAAVLVNADSRYSDGLANFFETYFTGFGGNVLLKEAYLTDTDNFTPLLQKIKGLNPDILFLPGNIVDAGRAIKQARAMGITIPVLGGDGFSAKMYEHAGAALADTYFSVHWHPENENPESRSFAKEFTQVMGSNPTAGTALAFDAVFLYADAVTRAGSPDPEKVREALADTRDFGGITGAIRFDENRNPMKSASILKFTPDKLVYLKTVSPW